MTTDTIEATATPARPPPPSAQAVGTGSKAVRAAALSGRGRPFARRAADRFRQGHAARTAICCRARATRTCSSASPRPMPTMPRTRSASTTTSRSCGSCPRRRCCRTAAPGAACRSRCFLNSVPDSLDGIVDTWNENVWLASRGGGIGTYWGNVRGIGEPVGLNGKTSGIIPFVRVMDSLTLAISQGSLRRGSAACYLDIRHPEIEEFLEIRKPSRRLQPQGAQPAPRRAHHRRVHGSGARRRRMDLRSPKDQRDARQRSTPARCSRSWSRPACRPASPTSSSPTT